GLQDAALDGHPDPRPAVASGPRAVHPVEALEDPRDVLGGDPRAGVVDRDRAGAVLAVGADGDGAAGGGEPEGIIEQVVEHLVEPFPVRPERREAGAHIVDDQDRPFRRDTPTSATTWSTSSPRATGSSSRGTSP